MKNTGAVTMVENCIQCSTKHIATAKVQWNEYREGKPEKLYDVIGHLSAAEEHLRGQHPIRANHVKTLRREIEGCLHERRCSHITADDFNRALEKCLHD